MKHYKNKKIGPFKIIFIVLGTLLIMGLIADLFSGFSYIRSANSIVSGLIGLVLIGFVAAILEGLGSWVGKIDKVEHSGGRRVFNFIFLLVFLALVVLLINLGW